jgi:rare lipoprotein A (peptidoglycan hydrolase)
MPKAAAWCLLLGWLCASGTAWADDPAELAQPSAWLDVQAPQPWEPGQASWYSHRFEGKRTASGDTYRAHLFSAAHRSLPLGTLVTVRNPDNQREVVVRINDRGPHHPQREIDLSHAAARALGILQEGVAAIEWQLAPPGASPTPPVHVPKVTKMPAKPRYKVPPKTTHRRQAP